MWDAEVAKKFFKFLATTHPLNLPGEIAGKGSNEAWVGIICEFVDGDDEDDMAANFMWFSTEAEIRNKDKKLSDFYTVCFWQLFVGAMYIADPLTYPSV